MRQSIGGWRGVVLSMMVGLGLGLPASAQALGPDEVSELAGFLQSFAAHFRFTGGQREDAARLAAIDDCVDEMLFIARPFARSRLRSATGISRDIAFDVNEAVLAIESSGDQPLLVPLQGPPVRYVSEAGDRLQTTLRRKGEKLILRTASDQGAEERVLTLSPDGEKLLIDVTILAERLPIPVRYRLSYRRLPEPAAPASAPAPKPE